MKMDDTVKCSTERQAGEERGGKRKEGREEEGQIVKRKADHE